jgi:hypothetical protein
MIATVHAAGCARVHAMRGVSQGVQLLLQCAHTPSWALCIFDIAKRPLRQECATAHLSERMLLFFTAVANC